MNDELIELARLGIDAETFMRSDLGKFISKKAEDERLSLIGELVLADPDDIKLNRDLRNKLHVVGMFLTWMGDAVNIGRAAHDQLEELDAGE